MKSWKHSFSRWWSLANKQVHTYHLEFWMRINDNLQNNTNRIHQKFFSVSRKSIEEARRRMWSYAEFRRHAIYHDEVLSSSSLFCVVNIVMIIWSLLVTSSRQSRSNASAYFLTRKKKLPFHPWLERCGSRSGCNAKTLCSLVWYLIGDHCLQLLMPFDFFDYLMDHDCVLICFFIGMQIQLARPPVVPTSKNSSRYKEEGGQSMCNKIRIIYFSFSAATPLVIFIRKHAA